MTAPEQDPKKGEELVPSHNGDDDAGGKNDPMERAIEAMKPALAKLTVGGVMGYCSGMALKKVGKVLATVIGLGFVAVQTAAYAGYIQVNWTKIGHDSFVKPFDSVSFQENCREKRMGVFALARCKLLVEDYLLASLALLAFFVLLISLLFSISVFYRETTGRLVVVVAYNTKRRGIESNPDRTAIDFISFHFISLLVISLFRYFFSPLLQFRRTGRNLTPFIRSCLAF